MANLKNDPAVQELIAKSIEATTAKVEKATTKAAADRVKTAFDDLIGAAAEAEDKATVKALKAAQKTALAAVKG